MQDDKAEAGSESESESDAASDHGAGNALLTSTLIHWAEGMFLRLNGETRTAVRGRGDVRHDPNGDCVWRLRDWQTWSRSTIVALFAL